MASLRLLALATVLVVVAGQRKSKYSNRYDNIDVQKILVNDRILKRYFDCLMDRVRCTAEGADLKRNIPEAIRTNCARCTEAQKTSIGKVFSYILLNKRSYWEELMAKYDPDGKYRRRAGFDEDEIIKLPTKPAVTKRSG